MKYRFKIWSLLASSCVFCKQMLRLKKHKFEVVIWKLDKKILDSWSLRLRAILVDSLRRNDNFF